MRQGCTGAELDEAQKMARREDAIKLSRSSSCDYVPGSVFRNMVVTFSIIDSSVWHCTVSRGCSVALGPLGPSLAFWAVLGAWWDGSSVVWEFCSAVLGSAWTVWGHPKALLGRLGAPLCLIASLARV